MMFELQAILPKLTRDHQKALSWFVEHAGRTVVGWPAPIGPDLIVATIAKGIYKPRWSEYALSVKQTLNSPYPDEAPVVRPDGTWRYEYAEERAGSFTTSGLENCIRDTVPVGVMRQVSDKSPVKYYIDGVALPVKFDKGIFSLEGFAPSGFSHGSDLLSPPIDALLAMVERVHAAEASEPNTTTDARERALRAIVQRRGQRRFRRELLRAYDGRCAVTGADADDALEAAHIVPYLGPETNRITNGLLLRADIHTLFDLHLIAVDTSSGTILLAPRLHGSSYSDLAGRPLRLPVRREDRPAIAALDAHREESIRGWNPGHARDIR